MKAVIFDLDETLLDRTRSLREFTMWQAKGMLRNCISDPYEFCDRFLELDANGSVWKDKVYAALIQEFNIVGWSGSELLMSYELCFSGFCSPKDGAIKAINELCSRGYKLGLITNGKSPFQERNFNSLGISSLFSSVIVSEAVGLRKPDKSIFELACSELGVAPDQVVFVGDNPTADIEGAKMAGMHTVYIPGFYGKECINADYVCSKFPELLGMVEDAI